MLRMLNLKLAFFLLISVAAFTGFNANEGDPGHPNDDVLGLLVFKSDLQNPPALSSWNEEDNSPCSWNFIRCDPVTGKVSELSLDGLSLSNKIGRGLEKLQSLKVLSLSHNDLSGNVGSELAQLSNLETLNLSHNSFSGRFPDAIANMSSIRILDLSENSISGPVPESVFENCFSLQLLSLAGNSLEGQVPTSLLKCSILSELNLSNNHFSGNLLSSSSIWSLNRLQVLDLSNNQFSGPVSAGISDLHNLKELRLQGNKFSGSIPNDIGFCPRLNRIDLSNNLFSGQMPSSLQRLNSVTHLDFSNNKLTGDLFQWISNMTSLEHLDFSSNGLTGTLPISLGSLTSLQFLSLSNNKLWGEIPTSLVYCNQLLNLQLRGNSFNGSIADSLFSMGLKELDLSSNELSGSIPEGSGKLFETLTVLDLSRNNLNGNIPPEIGLFSNLRHLNLSWNNLGSRMPLEIGYLQHLTVLDLRNSALYGPIPGEMCESGNLGILQLDGNSLSSTIPEQIGNCSSLYLLTLSHNNLSGLIPNSMSMLKKLEILRLEFNELSGEIPKELGMLQNLLAVNVSYNRLIGRLPPTGIFPSLDWSALQKNLGICSPLLRGPCIMNVQKPLVLDPYEMNRGNNNDRGDAIVETRRFQHHRFLTVSAIIAMSAAVAIIAGVGVIILLNVSARRRPSFVDNAMESMCSSSSRSETSPIGKLVLFDSRSSGEWDAKNLESSLNKASEIGGGVFGTVYKAKMGMEGKVVAIKKLLASNTFLYPKDFDRELRILGEVKHPNLVCLIGYYWTPKIQLLISDFATNGSLQSRFHDRTLSMPPLSWPTRFKIMLGTAKGLAHLHHSFNPPIVHYDLKLSNILLDENYNAKVSDFGLARLIGKHTASNRFQSALGYVVPEMACRSLKINEKCDVYGFGVIVLEIVTARRPVDYGEDNVTILNDHVRVMLEQGNVLDCVDASMGEFPEDEVVPVLKLALVCTSQVPSSRPSMAEVVQILQVIKTPVPHRMEVF
ncbi:hypothetical protein Nepgr_030134 [Nepenthes gracilis]|uniref:Protein kinase domain-containing protein n=1 Tax=Nepenthes gracilis TaxID=150966 RepID=A0AAD3Y695_NEPGR|nr:hypothetical protein Nepgr_030134 [Nepenthes gracilis]